MNWESIITNLLAALPPTILALAAWRSSKKTGAQVGAVHVLVNSQREAMVAEIDHLKAEVQRLMSLLITKPPTTL